MCLQGAGHTPLTPSVISTPAEPKELAGESATINGALHPRPQPLNSRARTELHYPDSKTCAAYATALQQSGDENPGSRRASEASV